MRFSKLLILFLSINLGGLVLGSWLMNQGPTSEWYLSLNQAPWTPPGWVFGVAWTVIMICFSVYLAKAFSQINSQQLQLTFIAQVFFNVIWNYIFFNRHFIAIGLVCIIILTFLIFYQFFYYDQSALKKTRLLLLPYMIWLLLAISLNAYILSYN
jgi:tryptophan-rich sensory protein